MPMLHTWLQIIASVAIALSEQIGDEVAACCPPVDPVQFACDKQLQWLLQPSCCVRSQAVKGLQ